MLQKFSGKAALAIVALSALMLAGCKKDAVTGGNGVPNPTTLQLQFTTGGKTSVFNYRKTNNGFTADSIILPRSLSYNCKTVVLDTTQNPAADLTTVYGVTNKRNYIFNYSFAPPSLPVIINVESSDVDDLGYSYGQLFHFTSFRDGTGSIRVWLKYGSDKRIADPNLSGGSTLIDATFPLRLL